MVIALLAELREAEGETSDAHESDVIRFIEGSDNGLLVARDGEAVVAMLSYAVFPSFFREARSVEVGHLVVRADHRRQGIATALLQTALRRFEPMGLHVAEIAAQPTNEAALTLYRRLGFRDETIGLERRFGSDTENGEARARRRARGAAAAGATIRPAAAADAAAMAGLIREMADEWEEPSPVTDDWVVQFLGDDACGAVVAELDGAVVGVVTWTLARGLFHARRSAIIAEAAVTRAYRDQGIGRALLEEALARIKRQDVAEISIGTGFENERAKHLYRSLGFTEETLLLEQHLE